MASKTIFKHANIKIVGAATLGITAKDVSLKVAGQGSVTSKGSYRTIDANISGQGNIKTNGDCQNYRASVSSMGAGLVPKTQKTPSRESCSN